MQDRQEIGRFGKVGAPLIIELNEWEGRKQLNIRWFFTDRTSQALKPSKRGISLTHGNFDAVYEILMNNHDVIEAWLIDAESRNKQLEARAQSLELANYAPLDVEVEVVPWKGRQFHATEMLGNSVKVSFNENHPYVRSVLDQDCSDQVLNHLAIMISTLVRSKNRFDDSETNYDILFDGLFYEWGKFLEKQIGEEL